LNFWGTTARAPPYEKEAHTGKRILHTRRFTALARCQPADTTRRFRQLSGAFAFAADAKRRAQALQDRHAVCAVSNFAERTSRSARAGSQITIRWRQFDHSAQDCHH